MTSVDLHQPKMVCALLKTTANVCKFLVGFEALLLLLLLSRWEGVAECSPIEQIAYITDMTNERQIPDLSRIVESLENLGVLDRSHTKCYSMDKIVKFQRSVGNGLRNLRIEFHVQEGGNARTISEYDETDDVADSAENSGNGSAGDGDGGGGGVGDSKNDNGDSKTVAATEATKIASRLDCFTKASPPDLPNIEPSRNSKDGILEYTIPKDDSGSRNLLNQTVGLTNTSVIAETKEERTLSLAQIMVISSCSIVIGLFFLAALSMRLRHCIQRKREERQNRRAPFRSNFGNTRNNSIAVTAEGVEIKQHKELKTKAKDKTYPVDRLQWYGRELLFSM